MGVVFQFLEARDRPLICWWQVGGRAMCWNVPNSRALAFLSDELARKIAWTRKALPELQTSKCVMLKASFFRASRIYLKGYCAVLLDHPRPIPKYLLW